MQQFYGTKNILAQPMTRIAYNNLRGWELPADENGNDEGYLVEYLDGGDPNVEGYAGYVSWSPRKQFENAYQPVTAMSFGHAIEAMKRGSHVKRLGWNGKDQYIFICDPEVHSIVSVQFICIRTQSKQFGPWLASQCDMLAEDWQVVA